ncbi:MAG: hypothetical protein ACQETV_08580, partial [Actinomycetota bacterium]
MTMSPLPKLRVRRLRVITLALTALLLAGCSPSPDETPADPATPDERAGEEPGDGDETDDGTDEAGDDGDERSDDGTDEADDVAAMTFTDCEADRYTVGYPADWSTTSGDGLLGACEVFHPGDIDEPEQPRDRDL